MKKILLFIFYALFFYVVVTSVIYRFAHPEQSETQLFLNLWDAITFNY